MENKEEYWNTIKRVYVKELGWFYTEHNKKKVEMHTANGIVRYTDEDGRVLFLRDKFIIAYER